MYVKGPRKRVTTEVTGISAELTFSDSISMTHELGHRMEDRNPEISVATKTFLRRRTAGLAPERYAKRELVTPDGFSDPYFGRITREPITPNCSPAEWKPSPTAASAASPGAPQFFLPAPGGLSAADRAQPPKADTRAPGPRPRTAGIGEQTPPVKRGGGTRKQMVTWPCPLPWRRSGECVRFDPQLQRHVRGVIRCSPPAPAPAPPAAVRAPQPRHLAAKNPLLQPAPTVLIHSANSSCRRPHDPGPGKTRNILPHGSIHREPGARLRRPPASSLKSGTVTVATPGRHRCLRHRSRAGCASSIASRQALIPSSAGVYCVNPQERQKCVRNRERQQ